MKKFRPTTPSRRNMTSLSYRTLLSGDTAHKPLTRGRKRYMGRNNAGRITTRHKGGGNKRQYRMVDFIYDKRDIPARVETIEYDPNRSSFIALVCYRDGERRYVLAHKDTKVGDTIIVSTKAPIARGNRLLLGNIPVGTMVYNLEVKPGSGAKLVRSAGNNAEVVAQDAGYTHVKMPSTEIRKILSTAWASIGAVGNEEYRLVKIGKAGRARHMGIRPTVRGTAMNPVDHPHGGGEGVQPRGRRRAISMWGKPTGKGQKTRTPKKYSNHLIVARRKVGRRK